MNLFGDLRPVCPTSKRMQGLINYLVELTSVIELKRNVLGSSSNWTFRIFVVVCYRQPRLKKSKQILEIQHVQMMSYQVRKFVLEAWLAAS